MIINNNNNNKKCSIKLIMLSKYVKNIWDSVFIGNAKNKQEQQQHQKAEKLLFLQKELRKGIICIVYIHNMFEFDASGNKQKQNKKRNKDWYWNVETPKKETKTKHTLFLLGYISMGIKLR